MKMGLISILGGITLVCLLGIPALVDLSPIIAAENGLLENTQVALIALSFIVFLLPVRRVEREVRCILFGGALLAVTCILREVDVEDLSVSRWVVLLGSGAGRNMILITSWVGLFLYTIKSFHQLKNSARRIAGLPFGKLIISAGVAMLIGDLFEKEILGVGPAQIQEELCETIGYLFLFIASFNTRRLSTQDRCNRES